MDINISHRPSYALADIKMGPGESIISEGGAMVTMSGAMRVETSTMSKGGGAKALLSGLKNLLAGESFFMNKFFVKGENQGHVTLAPTLVGDIELVEVNQGVGLLVQSSSFLARTDALDMDTKVGGFKSMFAGESLFWIKIAGNGPLLISSFGGIFHKDIDGTFICDTGHICAFEDTLSYKVKKVGGWKSTILSGEGLVTEFTGKGRLYMQTHNTGDFGRMIGKMLPPKG